MILLKQVRLVHWYGFSYITAPIGFFTLIAGKNGNGKSVMLDAIKYAAYGDTVFNKSSESKGTRTLSSYTRGLLDATTKTYMRPPEKFPHVYSHIALEYYDDILQKSFLLGTILETNVVNNIQSYRYIMDQTELSQVEHLYEEDGAKRVYSASQFQKAYGVTLFNREQGIARFMQMTGLKLSAQQTLVFLRKLRGIMTYDPEAKIDAFIKESVLEDRRVDFSRLIEAKENIERLNQTFLVVQAELKELEAILKEYNNYEAGKEKLLADDIKQAYKNTLDAKDTVKRLKNEQEMAERRQRQTERELETVSRQIEEETRRLQEVTASLSQLDCVLPIQKEEEHLTELQRQKKRLMEEGQELEEFQTKVSELCHTLEQYKTVIQEHSVPVRILASLSRQDYPIAEKQAAVEDLKQAVEALQERLTEEAAEQKRQREELERQLLAQMNIAEECKKNRTDFHQIPDYVKLKEEINEEFAKKGIASEAKFACEYVIGLTDEDWRDAIESYLGRRRYNILVEPQYYDIADEVLNRSKNQYAHLFNTKLLMKKELEPEEDSVVRFLSVKNEVAQKYFDYQLGRMKAVPMGEVKNQENAISKEGRVSVAMDGYFLRFDQIRFYYLGQETFELNRLRAEREIERLTAQKKALLAKEKTLNETRNQLREGRNFFKEYHYDAPLRLEETIRQIQDSEETLQKLRDAQKDNIEFVGLSERQRSLETSLERLKERKEEAYAEKSRLQSELLRCGDRLEERGKLLVLQEEALEKYRQTEYATMQKATQDYDQYLANGRRGPGGLLSEEYQKRLRGEIEQHERTIFTLQGEYNGRRSEGEGLPTGIDQRQLYENRRTKIWMDDLQEVSRKLDVQTRHYEEIFKNEFVLTILKSCNRSIEDLKLINAELAKLKFSTRYQFEVRFNRDASDYARVIDYARYLEEREQFGGGSSQRILGIFDSYSEEEAEQLEEDMKAIINRIISGNNNEAIEKFADYRNYLTYEILLSNETFQNARLSRQTGYNSGAEVQIPYMLILSSALLMIYNQRVNSTRLVFIDEPFAKMDPGNVKLMLDFLRAQNLQVIFCSPDKTESIGNECEVILPVLKVRADSMQLGIVQFADSV